MSFAGAMVIALAIDAVLGWPAPLYARIGHPVTWLGRLIAVIDNGWNVASDRQYLQRLKGAIACLVVVCAIVFPAMIIQMAIPSTEIGILLLAVLAWPFVAARSLYEHVAAVADPLEMGDRSGARQAVSMIVGRATEDLDDAGIARASIESLAENASDGVVAPLFWGVLFGLPGIAGYKAVNTLDSMIGHRTPRHEAFGWASARLDDILNFVPARLTAVLFALVSANPRSAFSVVLRDAKRHRSPNAGWPEAAMAGALDVRLSGPRYYQDRIADEPWVNEGGNEASWRDIRKGLRLYLLAMAALSAIGVLLAVVMSD